MARLQAEIEARQSALMGPPKPAELGSVDPAPHNPKTLRQTFVPEFGNCETHGAYPLNRKEPNGRVVWMPDVCKACLAQKRMAKLFEQAAIPPRFANCTFENYRVTNPEQASVFEQCQDYAARFPENLRRGTCLLLRGEAGTGKNHLSTAVMRAVLEQGFTALRVKAAAYLDAYWAKDFESRERWILQLGRIDLLMLDELGRTSSAKAAEDAFFRLIDARYEAGKPTMLITNLPKDDIVLALTRPGYDRLTQGGGNILHFTWGSYRAQAGEI